MKPAFLIIALLTSLGCGGEEERPNEILVFVGQGSTKFTINLTEFTIVRTTPTDIHITIQNGGGSPVKYDAIEVDSGGALLDSPVLLARGAVTDGRHDVDRIIVPGKTYAFRVAVYREDLTIFTCRFTEESCFKSQVQEKQIRFE